MKSFLSLAAIFFIHSLLFAKTAAFKAPVELTDSVIYPSRPVWIDADGNGVTDLVGYDYYQKSMVASLRKTSTAGSSSRKILEGVIEKPMGGPFRVDVDNDGKMDLVIQDGDRLLWWKQTQNLGLVFMQQWLSRLPAQRTVEWIADMDSDGILDILIRMENAYFEGPPEDLSPLIGYGDGNGGFACWLEITPTTYTHMSSDRGLVDLDGDGDLDWAFGHNQVAVMDKRSVTRIQSTPQGGFLIDIDDEQGAELILSEGFGPYPDNEQQLITVMKLNKCGIWETIDEYEPAEWWSNLKGPSSFPVMGVNFAATKNHLLVASTGGYVLSLVWNDGHLVESIVKDIDLNESDMLYTVDRDMNGIDSLMIIRLPREPEGYEATGFFYVNADIDGSLPPVRVSQYHDPRSLAVLGSDSGPKLASLGGADATLSLWNDLNGPSSRVVISTFKQPGIGLVGGNFRGNANNELALLISEEDSARKLTLNEKRSYLIAGRPYTNDGIALGDYRDLSLNGQMPATLLGAGDFDSDGIDDILYTRSSDGMMVWRSGFKTWGELGSIEHEINYMPFVVNYYQLAAATPQHIAIKDVDADGDLDLLQFPSAFGNVVALHLNDGQGHFSSPQALGRRTISTTGVFIGNLDGNSVPDIVTVSLNSFQSTQINVEHDMATSIPESLLLPTKIRKIAMADFNGDGLDDLVVAGDNYTPDGNSQEGRTWVLARKNSSEFHEPSVLPLPPVSCSALLAADLNRDGLPDIVWGSAVTGMIQFIESTIPNILPSFAAWSQTNNIAVNEDADGDGDGASNLQEYISGTDPNVSESHLPTSGKPGERPLLTILIPENEPHKFQIKAGSARPANLANGSVRIQLEESSNMQEWIPVKIAPLIQPAINRPDWETVSWDFTDYFDNEDPTPHFYRLKSWIEE